MVVNVSQKDKTIERVRERLSQAYSEITPINQPKRIIKRVERKEEDAR